jgi:TonB family protein
MRMNMQIALALLAATTAGCTSGLGGANEATAALVQQPITTASPVSALAQSSTRTPTVQANYGAKVAAAVRPHVIYPDPAGISGNPGVEFDVHLAPDGTITGVALRQSSGLPEWDRAAYRAVQKTQRFPPDDAGLVPARIFVTLRPKR